MHPITALIIGGQDIDRGDGKRGQVLATLPFQDHEGVRQFVQPSRQSIHREDPEPSPLGGEILLTPTGDIVLDLMVGMKFVAVVSRVRFKRQTMHRLDDRRESWPPRIVDCTTRPSVTGI